MHEFTCFAGGGGGVPLFPCCALALWADFGRAEGGREREGEGRRMEGGDEGERGRLVVCYDIIFSLLLSLLKCFVFFSHGL